jgi:putative ABC transport system permease protein
MGRVFRGGRRHPLGGSAVAEMSGWPFKRVLRPGATRSSDAELREEIELYLELRTEELVRKGHDPAGARRIAEERFGDVARIEAEARRAGGRGRREEGRPTMETLRQDVGYALRTFRRNPLFFVVGALTLALAVAGNTAVFSVLDAAVLEALPFPEADRLVFIDGYHLADGERAIRYASVPEFRDWRERSRTVSPMVAVDPNGLTLSGEGEAERITGELVSRGFFALMGGQAALGRTFTPEEAETPDGAQLVVLSDGLWQRRFAGDPSIVGRAIQLNDRPVTVLGVMPPGFRGVSPDVDAWLPIGMMSLVGSAEALDSRGTRFLGVIGRLAPGVDLARAQEDLDAVARELQAEYPDTHADRWARVQSFRDEYLGTTGGLLWILVGAGLLLLLIASANVANLLLVRAHARVRELALRRAVGADGGRVVGQLLTESLVLAAAGGAVGLGLAWLAIRGIVPSIPEGVLPDFVTPELSLRVFVFSFAVVGLAGLVAGTVPAASGARADLAGALRTGGRGATGRRTSAQRGFVVAQVGLALLLLFGAGLLTRSFRAQLAVDPGMDMRGMHVFRVQPPRDRYPDAASLRVFTHELVRRLETVPGVSAASASSDFPFRGRSSGSYIVRPEDPEHLIRYHRHSVSPGYLEKLGVRVLRGRGIEEQDGADARGVAVVTQALVDRVFPDDPSGVGRTIAIGNPRDPDNLVEIVGVVENVRYRDLTQDMMAEANSPDVFFSLDQIPSRTLEVSFRVRGDLAGALPAIRSAVAGLDPAIPIFAIDSLEHAWRGLTATPRFAAFLMGLFSLLAVVLSGVGIYGVLAFSVGQRTPEIALRRALGARAGEVAGSVITSSLRLVGVGLVLGGAGAALGSRVLRRFLFQVAPTDPMTFGAVVATMLAVAVVAAALPAWRAAHKSPAEALNAE